MNEMNNRRTKRCLSVVAAARLASQKHLYHENTPFVVEPYYKWLGSTSAAGDCETHLPGEDQLIQSVSVPCESAVLQYLMVTEASRADIERRLERESCVIGWPQSRGQSVLELKFKSGSGQRFPSPDWAKHCELVTRELLSQIHHDSLNVLEENWNSFRAQVAELLKRDNMDVMYHFDGDRCDLNLVGKKDAVEKFKTMAESVKASLEEELRIKQQPITEQVTLSRHQLMVLCLSNFADELNAAVGDVEVTITLTEVHMHGQTDNIKRAKVKLYEKLSQLQSDMTSMSKERALLINQDAFVTFLMECFRREGVVASWVVHDTELSLHAFSTDQLTIAKRVMESVIVEEQIPVDVTSDGSFPSKQKWSEFEQQLTAEHKTVALSVDSEGQRRLVDAERTQVIVFCCTLDRATAVRQQLLEFVDRNSIHQKFVSLLRPVADLLEQFMSNELAQIEAQLQERCPEGQMTRTGQQTDQQDRQEPEAGFMLVGSQSAIELAASQLSKLADTLAMYDHEIDRPGVPEYLMSTQGRAILSDLQRRHQAVIDVDSKGPAPDAKSSSMGYATAVTAEPVVMHSRKVSLVLCVIQSSCEATRRLQSLSKIWGAISKKIMGQQTPFMRGENSVLIGLGLGLGLVCSLG